MTDQSAQLAALQAQLAALGGAAAQAPAVTGWNQPAVQPGPAQVSGVAVPVKLPYGGGNIKIMLMLPADAAASPAALNAALAALEGAGIPLDIWRPSNGGDGGGSWGGSNRGGYRR